MRRFVRRTNVIWPTGRFVAAVLCAAAVGAVLTEQRAGSGSGNTQTGTLGWWAAAAALAYVGTVGIVRPLWRGGAVRRGRCGVEEVELCGEEERSLPVPELRPSEGLEVWGVRVSPLLGASRVYCHLMVDSVEGNPEACVEDCAPLCTVAPWLLRRGRSGTRSTVLLPRRGIAARRLVMQLDSCGCPSVTVRVYCVPTLVLSRALRTWWRGRARKMGDH